MPARMHSLYLREMYLNNRLAQPGGLTVDGVALDLRAIQTPSYFLAASSDHIAPWTSVYQGARLHQGPVRFVLSGSGHIAGWESPRQQQIRL